MDLNSYYTAYRLLARDARRGETLLPGAKESIEVPEVFR
jgi:hypothetical protein